MSAAPRSSSSDSASASASAPRSCSDDESAKEDAARLPYDELCTHLAGRFALYAVYLALRQSGDARGRGFARAVQTLPAHVAANGFELLNAQEVRAAFQRAEIAGAVLVVLMLGALRVEEPLARETSRLFARYRDEAEFRQCIQGEDVRYVSVLVRQSATVPSRL